MFILTRIIRKSFFCSYSIFVFSEEDKTIIINFALSSFFRNYSLYEYSFKARIDVELRTQNKDFKE